jgi:hypothetical protein
MPSRRRTESEVLLAAPFRCRLLLGLTLAGSCAAPQAHTCLQPALLHQRQDEATVQRLERAWSLAFLKGDSEFERCLLAPEFTEIMSNGEIKFLADELTLARANLGAQRPIPPLPKAKVLMYGNVAVAYGRSNGTAPDGHVHVHWYSDDYVWRDGAWHVLFAQQTAATAP